MCSRIAPIHTACRWSKRALQRLLESRDLRAHPALGELGENLRIPHAVHERVEHRPAGLAEDV
jgi:hypothetical protein